MLDRQAAKLTTAERDGLTPGLSVAIPCYNEVQGLLELHRRLTAVCRAVVGDDYEVVLVNDGSTDGSWDVIQQLAVADRHVLGVDLSRNFGHQLALTAALSYCTGDRILIIDADLQDPPELLPDMMRKMDEGADVVFGKRRSRQGETWFKAFAAKIFYAFLGSLTDVPVPRDTGDFRLINRRVADALRTMPEAHRFIRGMIAWVGFRQVPICYDRAPRFAGTTKYPLDRMVRLALDAITSFSVRPLRIAFYLGAFMCLLAAALIIVAIIAWTAFKPVRGWTSLIIVVLLIGGVQTFLLGVIGEYMSRLYLEAKSRPLYIVREIVAHGRTRNRRGSPTRRDVAAAPTEATG